MPMTPELLAYLAGFVDADGSISIVRTSYFDKSLQRKRFQYRIKLSAHNCKVEAVKDLPRYFWCWKTKK